MANQGKTLTALGSYWKGRKPLIMNKACILGCLLPASDDAARDLSIFEKLMAMDDESFVARWKRHPKPREILSKLSISRISNYFTVEPEGLLPTSAPVDLSNPDYAKVKVSWINASPSLERSVTLGPEPGVEKPELTGWGEYSRYIPRSNCRVLKNFISSAST